jgi:hypothetical protein
MNDAMLYGMLVSKHVDANAFTEKGSEHLDGAQGEPNLRSIINEQVWLKVSELRDIHTVRHLWLEQA